MCVTCHHAAPYSSIGEFDVRTHTRWSDDLGADGRVHKRWYYDTSGELVEETANGRKRKMFPLILSSMALIMTLILIRSNFVI